MKHQSLRKMSLKEANEFYYASDMMSDKFRKTKFYKIQLARYYLSKGEFYDWMSEFFPRTKYIN